MNHEKHPQKTTNKAYFKAMLPAFLGGIGMGIYYFTDGLFIGNALGDDGLSAISISWIIVTFLISVGTGIGMGGSIQYSIAVGKKDQNNAKNYFFTTVLLLVLASIILTVIFFLSSDSLLRFFGASGNVLKLSQDYTNLVVYCIIFQVIGIGAIPLVRNMGGHIVASTAMGVGYLINFVLDYVLMFVFPLGMLGCSIAYIAGQIVIAVPCMIFLYRQYKKDFKHKPFTFNDFSHAIKKITASGLSPFGIYFSQNLVLLFINRAFLIHGGSEALASYTVVIYIAGITNTLHRAIMDGSQPLMSRYYGEGDHKASAKAARSMYIFSGLLIITGAIATLLLKYQVASYFGVSEAVTLIVGERLPFYIIAYILVCFSRTTITYLFATEKNKNAGILTYAEPILYFILLMILPQLFGLDGIWATIMAVWASTAVLATIFLLTNKKPEEPGQQKITSY